MSGPYMPDGIKLLHGDCIDVMRRAADNSVDAIVTDPPYGLGFMGKAWDELPPGLPWAQECLRVLKPGGHLLAFGGTRTWHRLAVAVEDAGFEMRDSIAWLYGSGFPKSLDVSKAIDKAARGVPQGAADPTSPNHGNYRTTTTEGKRWDSDKGQSYGAGGSRFLTDTASARTTAPSTSSTTGPDAAAAGGEPPRTLDATAADWQGWGTALKPAFEPIVVGRKPLAGTVAANVLAHGTGALNVDGCRVGQGDGFGGGRKASSGFVGGYEADGFVASTQGRWPANVVLDEDAAAELDAQSGTLKSGVLAAHHARAPKDAGILGAFDSAPGERGYGDSGGASRFFYVAKAPTRERVKVDGVAHPTVKPLTLMRWLVRLVTPPGGLVLEPFAGSGTTLEACALEGFRCVGIERDESYLPLIHARLARLQDGAA